MPKDVSSSGEVESANPTTGSQPKPLGEAARYQCPVDFVAVSYNTRRSTFRKKLKKSSNELWLIKAPASFDPDCFQDVQVPLSGLQTLKVHAPEGGDQKNYNVRASAHGTSELYLLTSDKSSSESLVFGPTFSGLLTVCESYEERSGKQPLHVIPAAPAPSIPPGLSHRFPLLNQTTSTQTCAAKNEPEEPAKHFIEQTGKEEEGRKRKKKKKKQKKEKQIKLEQEEETDTLRVNENVSEIQDKIKTEPTFQEGEGSVLEKKKRKKKKKDNEQEETERVVEEVMVKSEPADSWSNDAVESSNKKKKKRKINGN